MKVHCFLPNCRSRREEALSRFDQSLLTSAATQKRENGSILIIVLWVAFGLIALTLYFAHSMSFELRASDNRAAAMEADQAIAGAARYVSNVLANVREPATLPDINHYRSEAVPIGDAMFWLIGRSDRNVALDQPSFGLVDEASKLNLNAPWLTVDILMNFPRMTAELAGSILDWRDTDSTVTQGGGAENDLGEHQFPFRFGSLHSQRGIEFGPNVIRLRKGDQRARTH